MTQMAHVTCPRSYRCWGIEPDFQKVSKRSLLNVIRCSSEIWIDNCVCQSGVQRQDLSRRYTCKQYYNVNVKDWNKSPRKRELGQKSDSKTDTGILQHFSRDAEKMHNNNKERLRGGTREGGLDLGGHDCMGAKWIEVWRRTKSTSSITNERSRQKRLANTLLEAIHHHGRNGERLWEPETTMGE